jgi:hypothetical protein
VSLPPFFIALAALTLVLALVALWNSLRVVLGAAGGADEGGHSLASAELPDRAALLDEKKSLLRAIKDLEYEHAVGKIGEDDFLRLDQAYRLRAKEVLALLDADLAPYQARAEALLASTLAVAKVAKASPASDEAEAPADDEALRQRARALREEAERLERLAAAKTTRAPEEPAKASEEPVKASEEPAKASEEPAKASEEPGKTSEEPAKDATVKPSEDA